MIMWSFKEKEGDEDIYMPTADFIFLAKKKNK